MKKNESAKFSFLLLLLNHKKFKNFHHHHRAICKYCEVLKKYKLLCAGEKHNSNIANLGFIDAAVKTELMEISFLIRLFASIENDLKLNCKTLS
jgi:hypothetical protein